MKKIIEQLEEIALNIRYDIKQDWNENKFQDAIQVSKIESAIALLTSVGKNNNIAD